MKERGINRYIYIYIYISYEAAAIGSGAVAGAPARIHAHTRPLCGRARANLPLCGRARRYTFPQTDTVTYGINGEKKTTQFQSTQKENAIIDPYQNKYYIL